MFNIDAVITVQTVFIALIALYAVILIPYYATSWQGIAYSPAGSARLDHDLRTARRYRGAALAAVGRCLCAVRTESPVAIRSRNLGSGP